MELSLALCIENSHLIRIYCEQSVEGIQDKKDPVHFLEDSYRVSPSSAQQDMRFMVCSLQLPQRNKNHRIFVTFVLLIQSCDATSHTKVYCRLLARHGVSDHATSLIGFATDRTCMVIYGDCKQMDAGFVMQGRFSVVNKFQKRRIVNWN
jgi:hypothetical protein